MTTLGWRCLEIGCGAGALLLVCRFLRRLHDEPLDVLQRAEAPRHEIAVRMGPSVSALTERVVG